MASSKLDRRAFLLGAGGIAVALPWLEAFDDAGSLQASGGQGSDAKRFLAVYTPGGTVRDRFTPTGSEDNFQLSTILAPLAQVQDKLIVLDGLAMDSARGEQHQAGIIAWLTGTEQSNAHRRFAGGPSIDQVIASRISRGRLPFASLEIAIRWATGNSRGLVHPINICNFQDNAEFSPIPPRIDPAAIFDDLFGGIDPGSQQAAAVRLKQRKSVLDYVDRRYATLSRELGQGDRAKLEQHLTKIREIERSLEAIDDLQAACRAPERIDTSGYDPGLGSGGMGGSTDAAIPLIGTFMMDMMIMAMACDLTAVGTLQWTDTEAKHTFPWLGLSEHHHFYQHDGGFRPDECARIYTWYAEQHAYLLEQMDAIDMGGHSLLDESVVFFGSELQSPASHRKDNMPFLLAGCGGGLRSGRWIQYPHTSHNNLLVSLLGLFGDTRPCFGDMAHCSGPLSGLV